MRGATQLPPGRHGLSRDEVQASQRTRMLLAMADAVAERGYAGTPVADVIRRAGVSRETFYEQFRDKEACFLAAFDAAVADLTSRVAAAVGEETTADPLERLDAALAAYLDVLSRERSLARTFLIEVYGAGPAALRQRVAVLDGFVALVADELGASAPTDKGSDPLSDKGSDPLSESRRFACEALVGAVSSMVTMRIAVGDHEGLPELRAPLMDIARRLLAPRARPVTISDPQERV